MFQGTVTPEGVNVGLCGPIEGVRHYACMCQLSGVQALMQARINVLTVVRFKCTVIRHIV